MPAAARRPGYAGARWPGPARADRDGPRRPSVRATRCSSTAPTTRPGRRSSPGPSTTSGRSWPAAATGAAAAGDPRHRRRWPTRTSPGVLAALAASPVARVGPGHLHPGRPAPGRCRPARSRAAGRPSRRAPSREVVTPVEAALDRALAEAPGPVVVAGSLYLVGAVRARLVDDPALRDEPGGPADGAPVPTPPWPASGERRRDRSARPRRDRIGGRTFRWGERTLRHGDPQRHPGLVLRRRPPRAAGRDPVAAAVAQAVGDGRRGRRPARRRRRIDPAGPRAGRRGRGAATASCPVVAAIRAALPETPISVDTTKPAVAAAALDAGADLRQRRLGRRRGRRPAPARGRARRPDRPDAQPRGAALRGPRGRGRSPTCGGRSSGRSAPAAGGSR